MATTNQYVNLDDPRNQFAFVCPVFETTTKMSQCMKLRELFWRGQRPDVRKGCQLCMRAGKCPAAAIASKRYPQGKSWKDDYASDTPVLGKIRRDILERVQRPIVVDSYYREFPDVSEQERDKLLTASDRIGKMIGAAPLSSDNDEPRHSRTAFSEASTPRKPRKAAPKAHNDDINTVGDAAASGDLAAAINAA